MSREETKMNRGKIGKRVTLMLSVAGTMLLLACGAALAAQIIHCHAGRACNGTAKADTMSGSNGGDKMNGRGKNDLMRGNRGFDTIKGSLGADTISGGYGIDNLSGGSDNDAIRGDYGNDTINGGPGKDAIDGGLGDDTINADDGKLDSVSCGPGTDVVYVDQEDLDAEDTNVEDFVRLTSCEIINEPSPPAEGQIAGP